MENIEEKIEKLGSKLYVSTNEINELRSLIDACEDAKIKNEYINYLYSIIPDYDNQIKELRTTLEEYFNSKPDPIKLHYKILYKKLL